MTRNDGVLLLALLPSLVMAGRARALGEIRLLQPLDPSQPGKHRLGDRLLFRYVPITAHGYAATVPARLLLVLLLFPLWAILLDLLIPGRGALADFVGRTGLWMLWIAIIAGGWATVWVGALVVVVAVIGAAYNHSPTALAVTTALLFGIPAGGFACWNYRTLLHETRMEVRRRRARNGKRLKRGGMTKKRFQLLLLYAVPFMMLYEMVRAVRPEIDLSRWAEAFMIYPPPRYALHVLALGLSWNLLLGVVPLFRDMVERASAGTAAGFNNLLLQFEAQKDVPDDDPEKKSIADFYKGYLGAKGEWIQFGPGQRLLIFLVVLVLTVNGMGQSVEKMINAGLSPPDARLTPWLNGLGWLMLVANGWFLLMLFLGTLQVLFGGPRVVERTAETLWQSVDQPDLVVVCRPNGAIEPATSPPPLPSAAELAPPKVVAAAGCGTSLLVWINFLAVLGVCVLLIMMESHAKPAGARTWGWDDATTLRVLRYAMPGIAVAAVVLMLTHPSVRSMGIGTLLTAGVIFATCKGYPLIYTGAAGTHEQWQQLAGLWSAFTIILLGFAVVRKR